ncbi:hypothetical protein O7635_09975 [Asanoa sp. WMMD1127]|uniref:hypothetical protein n=1 Tax=Asanoa sp. WMMD1127 TaxID=3016107 RepID=UPI002415DFE0|nr:hypothetical protein [Asanoa sp. WMMD1127]MDG4822181.1 hypothetical protein [Asanoa sp. WMMD1127]
MSVSHGGVLAPIGSRRRNYGTVTGSRDPRMGTIGVRIMALKSDLPGSLLPVATPATEGAS